ncbi:ATP-dependent DNA ligase [Rhizoclosmatium globosum]|uniref:DNA ligase n=1 Tax=Rhizoclosmatium globosum TaxID=329046 RepID=A0A1Y2BRP9_9FUNG|nr:ATP-dependent DNA ligase [Rhizoclosmatium globosum]|eukprot:ORY37420.1 ATP-dependent DNA ligase [Rhizoclosmatium globosum]
MARAAQKMTLQFASLCKTLDTIQRTKGHAAKKKMVATLLHDRTNALVTLSLVLPHLDQRVLGVKDKTLARLYSEALGIEGTSDAARLLDWRNPALGPVGDDFAATLYAVVRDRSQAAASSLSVDQINEKIADLAKAENNVDRKAVVAFFVTNLSPTEHKWLARIILKEMKLGITEKTVFDAWHPEAQDLYNITSSLARVCEDLADPSVSVISSSNVSLNFPFKPMLSKSVKTLAEVEKVRGGKTFWIETKLDGERMQLHKSGGNYKWFSRNAKDYTHLYGGYKDEKLAQAIHDCFIPQTENCILDGEMMSYNVSTGLFESFGALKTAANLYNTEGESASSKPVYIVFDLLYYNGKSLLESPLQARYNLLKSVIKEKKNKMELLTHVEGTTTDDVIKALDASMVRHEEGIVIKSPESVYLLNDRGGQWLKVKPDYIDSLGDDLDLVLIGGFYGQGRRGGKLSHFMCAVLDDSPPNTPLNDRKYITFCKFGSGYTLSQIEEIAHESAGHWQVYDHTHPPPWFVHPAASKEKPDMILHPSHSRVVTVKAAEVVESMQYACGWTLRFPRFVSVRTDKNIEDALSKTGLEEYVVRNKGRMQSRRFGDDDDSKKGKPGTPRKGGAGARSVAHVSAEYQAVKLERTEVVSEDAIFKGVEVCVIPGSVLSEDGECLKHRLEKEVIKHGGTCVQNPRLGKTTCVIAEKILVKVTNLIKEALFDVVKPMWVLESIDSKERIPLEPRFMIFTAKETQLHFKKVNDRFGDSFSRDATDTGLTELFEGMVGYVPTTDLKRKQHSHTAIQARQKQLKTLAEYEAKLVLDVEPSEGRLLRHICAYLDVTETVPVSSLMLDGTGHVDGTLLVTENSEDDKEDAVSALLETVDYNSLRMLEPEIKCRGGQVARRVVQLGYFAKGTSTAKSTAQSLSYVPGWYQAYNLDSFSLKHAVLAYETSETAVFIGLHANELVAITTATDSDKLKTETFEAVSVMTLLGVNSNIEALACTRTHFAATIRTNDTSYQIMQWPLEGIFEAAMERIGNVDETNDSAPPFLSTSQAVLVVARNLPPIVKMQAGYAHFLALTVDGRVLAWADSPQGAGSLHGQLGSGSMNSSQRCNNVKSEDDGALWMMETASFIEALLGLQVTDIGAGGHHSVVIVDHSIVYTFGSNSHGQLGRSKKHSFAIPIPLNFDFGSASERNPLVVSCGERHTVVACSQIKNAVEAWGWGDDDWGALTGTIGESDAKEGGKSLFKEYRIKVPLKLNISNFIDSMEQLGLRCGPWSTLFFIKSIN